MTKCPKCRVPGQTVPGYIIKGKKIARCAVCKGHGFTTAMNADAWKGGCDFPPDNS